ncbi:MAG: (d)CMP kinase [candidate division WOR-3 bacterium]
MRKIVIAIDGTAGSGKTTLCLKLAYLLNYVPVLTGKLYRGIGAYIKRNNLKLEEIKKKIKDLKVDYKFEVVPKVFVNGIDLTEELDDPVVERITSEIAEYKEVREHLYHVQRKFVDEKGVVMEGRDIGTVIARDADLKFYMDADLMVRAQRRYRDFLKRGEKIDFERVFLELEKRDKRDKSRENAPLKIPEDAYFIDTTNKKIEDVLILCLKLAYEKIYKSREKFRWKFAYYFTYPFIKWLFGMKIEGRKNLFKKGPCIITPNHTTFWDPPFIGFAAKRESYFLAKIDLFLPNPLFAWLIRTFNAIPIKRGIGAVSAYEKAEELLESGKMVVIFPEGTRSKTGTLLPFKKGAASLACNLRVPVIPAYIKNVRENPLKWILRKKRLSVKFGVPLLPFGNTKEYIEEFNKKIEEEVKKLSLT